MVKDLKINVQWQLKTYYYKIILSILTLGKHFDQYYSAIASELLLVLDEDISKSLVM